MKAKIKETGEIIEVFDDSMYYVSLDGKKFYTKDEVSICNEIDWEQRRYEIAKECVAVLMNSEMSLGWVAKMSVEQADALIEELKK